MHFRRIRLLVVAIALLGAGISEQLRLTSSRNDGRHQSESAIRAVAVEQLKLQSSVPLVGRSVDRRSGAGCNRVLQEPRRLLDGEVAAKFMSGALDLPQVQKLMSSGGALPVENTTAA